MTEVNYQLLNKENINFDDSLNYTQLQPWKLDTKITNISVISIPVKCQLQF